MEKHGEIREGVTPEPGRGRVTVDPSKPVYTKVGQAIGHTAGLGRVNFDDDVTKRGADEVARGLGK